MEVLKKRITDFDLAVPGRLRTIYSKCGKAYCACQTDKKARHGPYILWDRKVNGQLTIEDGLQKNGNSNKEVDRKPKSI